MKEFSIISKNGKRKVIIKNTSTGIDNRKAAIDVILKNQH